MLHIFQLDPRRGKFIKRKGSDEKMVIVRDDSEVTGKIWIAPVHKIPEMYSVTYEQLQEDYETFTGPIPKRRGRPKGSKNKPKE